MSLARVGGVELVIGVAGHAIDSGTSAIDIDRNRLEIARHNARVYGVEHKIDFIHGDYMKLAAKLTADVVFLAPPWGGPSYAACSEFSLRMTTPNSYVVASIYHATGEGSCCWLSCWPNSLARMCSVKIYEKTLSITRNIALYLPKNTSTLEVRSLSLTSNGSKLSPQGIG